VLSALTIRMKQLLPDSNNTIYRPAINLIARSSCHLDDSCDKNAKRDARKTRNQKDIRDFTNLR
ncbi:MAG: hypothetical protein ACI3YC_05105, partial [Alloprevotella sp.]